MAEDISAIGPGLISGVVDAENLFTIIAEGLNVSKVGITFDGPSRPQCKRFNKPNGHLEASYTVTVPGDYTIHVTFDDDEIEGSPYHVKIQ